MVDGYSQVSSVAPFTYRDGATFLEILTRLTDFVNKVLVANLNDSNSSLKDEIVKLVNNLRVYVDNANIALSKSNTAYTDIEIAKLKEEMVQLIVESTSEGVMFNPINGVFESGSKVVSDIYDNLRYFAYFTSQFDALELSATDYDTLNYTARKYDLSPTNTDNRAYLDVI